MQKSAEVLSAEICDRHLMLNCGGLHVPVGTMEPSLAPLGAPDVWGQYV